MTVYPDFLKKGDKIAIIAPARKISLPELKPFIRLANEAGFETVYSDNLFLEDHQFAGTDLQRAADFQRWLDDAQVKAIISARGGYGTARIIDLLDFSQFKQYPKWLIGFSDFTVIHNHVNSILKCATLHASMPIFLKQESEQNAIDSFLALFETLNGNIVDYKLEQHPLNRIGNCSGNLCGGNLSVIFSLMGSVSEIDTQDGILYLEDLDEYLYHIDRMLLGLKRAGKFKTLKGVLIGHMNDMHDNKIPFGKSAEEIIWDHFEELNIPIYFGLQSGHLNPNFPIVLGGQVKIENNYLNFGLPQNK